jgi:hypothetical protein
LEEHRNDLKNLGPSDENGQVTQPGTYFTKDTILSIYDAMTESIRTGIPYQTRLDPPHSPPVDSEGNFIPWLSGIRATGQHIFIRRDSKRRREKVDGWST